MGRRYEGTVTSQWHDHCHEARKLIDQFSGLLYEYQRAHIRALPRSEPHSTTEKKQSSSADPEGITAEI